MSENRYGLTDRELHRLVLACGRRVCSTTEHYGCPYGDEDIDHCVDMLDKDHETMILRLIEAEDKGCGGDSCQIGYDAGAFFSAEHLIRPCGEPSPQGGGKKRAGRKEERGETEMTAEREADILERAIDAYGVNAQTDVMIEEMSELTKALLKLRRAETFGGLKPEHVENILEEMADVQIMLNQMCLIYGDFNEQEIAKLERLDTRMKEAGV